MTDPSREHARPEAQPMADARQAIQRAASALRATSTMRPDLGHELGRLHVQLLDIAAALRELERS